MECDRRDFLKAALVAPAALSRTTAAPVRSVFEPFDYRGVRLRESRWRRQYEAGRGFYLGVSDDDVLHGFRKAVGLPAPGRPLGGWCGVDSSTVFGQWLSGLSRMYASTGDEALRDKALRLFSEWARTIPANGDPRMGHYPIDKLVGGLVDLELYAGYGEARPVLERVSAYAAQNLERPANPREALADPTHNQRYYGDPQEWYTLSENLYRAFELTGDEAFRSFAKDWLYHAYWRKFETSSSPPDAHGVHAYSHVNTFASAAMAHRVEGDPRYLAAMKNAYDYLARHQSFATGGYGPNERFMALDGSLGRALETRSDTCETSCGSWAGFKLARYLQCDTGEARYGDWIERLLYNGIGAALPIAEGGRNFYYGDYRLGGGMKVYNWDTFTCCAGTYVQNLAEYENLVYFRDESGIFVNLYLPSDASWQGITLTQNGGYPDSDRMTFTLSTPAPRPFALRFRVPGWTDGFSVAVNGTDTGVTARPSSWAAIERTWRSGDHVDVRIPLTLRMEPVDEQHPDRVAVVRGPVVLVLEGAYHDPAFALPSRDEDLERWLTPEEGSLPRGVWSTGLPERDYPTSFRVTPPDGRSVRLRFRPFYEVGESYPYFMYFDRTALPWRLW